MSLKTPSNKTIKKAKPVKIRVVKSRKKNAALVQPTKQPVQLPDKSKKAKFFKSSVLSNELSIEQRKKFAWAGALVSLVLIIIAWAGYGQIFPKKDDGSVEADRTLWSLGNVFSQITTDFDEHTNNIKSQLFNLQEKIDDTEALELDKKVFPQFYQ